MLRTFHDGNPITTQDSSYRFSRGFAIARTATSDCHWEVAVIRPVYGRQDAVSFTLQLTVYLSWASLAEGVASSTSSLLLRYEVPVLSAIHSVGTIQMQGV